MFLPNQYDPSHPSLLQKILYLRYPPLLHLLERRNTQWSVKNLDKVNLIKRQVLKVQQPRPDTLSHLIVLFEFHLQTFPSLLDITGPARIKKLGVAAMVQDSLTCDLLRGQEWTYAELLNVKLILQNVVQVGHSDTLVEQVPNLSQRLGRLLGIDWQFESAEDVLGPSWVELLLKIA